MKWLLLLVLVATGSCAVAPAATMHAERQAPDRADTLLRKLALDVPTDVARLSVRDVEPVAPVTAAAPAFVEQARSADDAARALDCLTTAIYYEARSEPLDGQRAVAQVVLNRVRDRAFPRSICGVVYQGSERRTGCQFSFTCDGSMNRPRDPAAWARSGMVAAAALAGDVYAPVGSATHFHTSAISPWWAPSLTRLATVGAHVFYRWPRAMERALTFRQEYGGFEPAVGWRGGEAIGADEVIATLGIEQVNGVTIHRGLADAGEDAAPAAVVDSPAAPARPIMVAGVRVHHGVAFAANGAGSVRIHRAAAPADDQASSSPTPIDARAASASFETTGYAQ